VAVGYMEMARNGGEAQWRFSQETGTAPDIYLTLFVGHGSL